MSRTIVNTSAAIALTALTTLAGSIAMADPPAKTESTGKPEMQLPPGWTQADMQAVVAAATPGKMHKHLTSGAGVWNCNNTMWMGPDAEPIKTEGTTTITPILGGRFIKLEMIGEMPGPGKYKGVAIYGYDKVSDQFVSTWADNMGTGIANGVGELSADGKTLTWTYTYNCPITKKPAVMREVEKITGPDTRTLVMYGADPKTGEEFKMMKIELTRESNEAESSK